MGKGPGLARTILLLMLFLLGWVHVIEAIMHKYRMRPAFIGTRGRSDRERRLE